MYIAYIKKWVFAIGSNYRLKPEFKSTVKKGNH